MFGSIGRGLQSLFGGNGGYGARQDELDNILAGINQQPGAGQMQSHMSGLLGAANGGAASITSNPPPLTRPLGNSMRQPFDYDAALRQLAPADTKPNWSDRLGNLATAFAQAGAMGSGEWEAAAQIGKDRQLQASDALRRRMTAQAEVLKWKRDDWARQNEADLKASNPYTIGRSRLAYNPASGTTETQYKGNADFEDYAAAQGLKAGTPEYFGAVTDYVLRANGPTALRNDMTIDDHRTGNRSRLETLRQGNRVSLERVQQGNRVSLRGTPTYRDLNPRTAGAPRIGDIPVMSSPQEAMKLPPGTKFRTPDGQVKVRP